MVLEHGNKSIYSAWLSYRNWKKKKKKNEQINKSVHAPSGSSKSKGDN